MVKSYIKQNRLPNGTPRMYVRHQRIEGLKTNDFLKDQKLLVVPFDKRWGFCVMKQKTYSDKLNEILSSSQFEPHNGESDDLTIRTEKLINSSLHQLMKQGKISEKIYHRLRTTGSQPARFYNLAKLHKIGTPLQPVLSIPGSSYENLNKFLSPFFEKLPGANIETNSQERCQSSSRGHKIGWRWASGISRWKKLIHQCTGLGSNRNCA